MTEGVNRKISLQVEQPAAKDLAVLVETGLMSPENKQALAVATTNLDALKAASTKPGERHFHQIDTMIAVRNPSPIAQARECLTNLEGVWEGLREDFHKYRKLFLSMKVRRAELAKMKKQIDVEEDEIERTILEAKYDLELASIDEMESEIARGERIIKDQIENATEQSRRYEVILQGANKDAFTQEDFREEEMSYYIKSAFWHAAKVFTFVETDIEAMTGEKAGGKKIRKIRMDEEVYLYFESLGVSRQEVRDEVGALQGMREAFEVASGPGFIGSFMDHFEGWLNRTAQKYKERIRERVANDGFDRLKRIAGIIDPDSDDVGTTSRFDTQVDRGSIFK